MTQAVSSRLLTAEVPVWFRRVRVEYMVQIVAFRQSLSPSTSALPSQHHSTNASIVFLLMQTPCKSQRLTASLNDAQKHFCTVTTFVQGGSNMTGTNCDLFTHKSSRSYLNHLVHLCRKTQPTQAALLLWCVGVHLRSNIQVGFVVKFSSDRYLGYAVT